MVGAELEEAEGFFKSYQIGRQTDIPLLNQLDYASLLGPAVQSTDCMLQEEVQKEKEAKTAETARYEKEMEAAARLAVAEKLRRAAARAKEIERSKKVEKSRSETEQLLIKQQEEIEKKKVGLCHDSFS